MPQEVSVSYRAIKRKVYRLIDARVDGDKTEADVQESLSRRSGLLRLVNI